MKLIIKPVVCDVCLMVEAGVNKGGSPKKYYVKCNGTSLEGQVLFWTVLRWNWLQFKKRRGMLKEDKYEC